MLSLSLLPSPSTHRSHLFSPWRTSLRPNGATTASILKRGRPSASCEARGLGSSSHSPAPNEPDLRSLGQKRIEEESAGENGPVQPRQRREFQRFSERRDGQHDADRADDERRYDQSRARAALDEGHLCGSDDMDDKVCVRSDSTNQPVRNSDGFSGRRRRKASHRRSYSRRSS